MKSYHIRCPKCNNNHSFYRYGKDFSGSFIYLHTPRMTVPAFPARSLCRISWYFCRLPFILFIIPFTERLAVCYRQIIISGKDFSLRTNGAYRTFHTGIDNRFPLVTAFTASPPDIFPRLCIYFINGLVDCSDYDNTLGEDFEKALEEELSEKEKEEER